MWISLCCCLCSETRVLGALCPVRVSVTAPAESCVLSLPSQMSRRSYAYAGCHAVFGSLDAAGFFELLNMNKKAALVIFIGRMMEEKGVRCPEENRVCDVAERILAAGAHPEAFTWLMKDLEQIVAEAKPSSSRGPEVCKCFHGMKQHLDEKLYGAPKDDLCYAASKGCLCCVRRLLEERRVNPSKALDRQGYSVLDWSLWARNRGVEGADAVTQYICNGWQTAQCKRSMDEPAGSHGHGVCGLLRRAPPPPPPKPRPSVSSAPRPKRSPGALRRSCVPKSAYALVTKSVAGKKK